MRRTSGEKGADTSRISYYDGARVGRLEGKVAIVTGGARGIGRAIVEKCAEERAAVAGFDVDTDEMAAVANALAGRGRQVAGWTVDVTVESSVARGVEAVVGRYGRVDILINNAGVNAYHDAVRMTDGEWERVFAVDLKGAWLCAKHVLPGMIARGRGAIVNIASIHASLTMAGMFPYAAAKSGLVGLSRSLALDYAARGIRVNVVSPGWTRTQLVEEWFARQSDPRAAESSILAAHPIQRIATPEEIANVVAFVASDEASAMTGTEVHVDGGLGARFATG
jgi:NAD(P)-dependent dehydrogenase (short-subunit alcohol dehydrogenase family)